MVGQSNNLISELEKIAVEIKTDFGGLSSEQLNWKPSAGGWSAGQCFEHLIKTNSLFFPELERIARGKRQNSFWENYSPLSSFFGNLMVNSLKKDGRKTKAPTPEIVPPPATDERIIEQFAEQQTRLIEKIKQTETADWEEIKLTSPFMRLITYKLIDAFRIIVEHERRHGRQAARVTQEKNFPKN